MKLKLLLPMAVCILGFTGCEKTNVEPEGSLQANSAMNSGTTPNTVCDVISFKDVNGFITQVYSDGGFGPIAVTSNNASEPGKNLARVYSFPTSGTQDPDLSSAALGNILFSQDDNQSAPNDYAGDANFTFDFVGTVTATSLTFIDIEEAGGYISLYTDQGGTQLGSSIPIPTTANGATQVVSLGNTAGVGYIVVHLEGSGGLDNLRFCREVRQRHCNYTQGYWKNHEEAWPVSSLTIGNVTYSQEQLLTILRTPVRGNGLISLAHQLIAAKLNVALDGDTSISGTISSADALIGNLNLFSGYLPTSQTSALNDLLDDYNNSDHCD